MRIYKYELNLGFGVHTLETHVLTEFLHFGWQRQRYCAWALVDERATQTFTYEVVKTGEVPTIPNAIHLVSLVAGHHYNDDTVYHFFVQGTPPPQSDSLKLAYSVQQLLVVDKLDYPESAIVFEYEKQDGTRRGMAMTHVEFGRNEKGEQYVSGYDHLALGENKFRTAYLHRVVAWAKLE